MPSYADPQLRPRRPLYSLDDVVALRTLAILRERGLPVAQLRRVRAFFAAEPAEAWRDRCLHAVDRRVFFAGDDAPAVSASERPGETWTLPLRTIVDEVTAAIGRLGEREPGEIGQIASDRQILEGAPVVAGTRIPTATIYAFHRRGYTADDIRREFPRLEPIDTNRAIAFEEGRRARATG